MKLYESFGESDVTIAALVLVLVSSEMRQQWEIARDDKDHLSIGSFRHHWTAVPFRLFSTQYLAEAFLSCAH